MPNVISGAGGVPSEMAHELDHRLVSLGYGLTGVGAVDVALVVDAYVGLQPRCAQTQRYAAREAVPLRIVGLQCPVLVRDAFAVVGHVVVAAQKGDGGKHPLQRQSIGGERIRCIHGWEIGVQVSLAQVFSLDVPPPRFVVRSRVVHIDFGKVRARPLEAGDRMEPIGHYDLRLYREVVVRSPEILLVGQPRAVEDARFERYRASAREGEARHGTYVPDVPDLLGDERPIGEVLQVGRSVGVDRERYAHLPDRKAESSFRGEHYVSVEHSYSPLVGEVYLGLVVYDGKQPALYAYPRVAYLEASFAHLRLVLVFGPYGGVHVGPVCERVGRSRPRAA